MPPCEDGFFEAQAADDKLALQQGEETEDDLKFGGFEEIDPGVFHVGHDQSAQADAVPWRVDGAADIERQTDGIHGGLAQLLLHGGRLEMQIEGEDGGQHEDEHRGEGDEAGAEAARHGTLQVTPTTGDAKREALVARPGGGW